MNPAEFSNIAKTERDFWWYRGMRRITFRMLAPYLEGRRIARVLEIGAGTGYFSKILEQRYGWRMFPLDLGRAGLQHGLRLGVQRMVQADMRSLPYGDGSFDAVFSMDVLVHVPRGEERGPLQEMIRALRPGGLFVLRVSALNWLRSRHSEFAYERQRFTKGRLLRCVRPLGLRVLRCTYANSLLLPVAVAKFRIWEPLMRRPPASGVQPIAPWLNWLLEAPLRLEAAWIGAGRGFPIGQSLFLIGEKQIQD